MLKGIKRDLDYSLLDGYVAAEGARQEENISLIASENYASKKVLEMQGSKLTNKYAEGYPKKRFYAGCECADQVEQYAIDLLKQLFGADYANVQPHSGSQANCAVLSAILNRGDTMLGMRLADGGHLTHGHPASITGKTYNALHYGVDKNGWLDYDEAYRVAVEHKPKLIIAGCSAYTRLIDWKKFREIADEVGAYFHADIAHTSGTIAAKLMDSPIDYAHVITSTTHKTLGGPRGAFIISKGQDESFYRKLNSSVFPGHQGGPLEHVIAARAAAFLEALQPEFVDYQRQILLNSRAMSDYFVSEGFKLVTGGTDNHMVLVDVTPTGLSGLEVADRLAAARIVVNQNVIPGETRPPFEASGIRAGAPAITRRGFKEEDVAALCKLMVALMRASKEDLDSETQRVSAEVSKMCLKFPVYN